MEAGLVHLGPSPATSVCLAKIENGVMKCPGCEVSLCSAGSIDKVKLYCPRCLAVIWYYYMGSIKTISMDSIRDRVLPQDKSDWNELDLCSFFIKRYEKETGNPIDSSDAIYPAFGHYFDSKLFRYIEHLFLSLFNKDIQALSEYIYFFNKNLKDKDGFHWSWIGNFKIAEHYIYSVVNK